ncbi:MAG: hypothetical protein IZT59_11980 [Verrucomicrobia bacterium]|jgi:antitoxin component of MazEF toxin-antitoxin module|nr:hypothetical protein [Verrucomicrobiota bacterium]|tara:strand:- start:16197 stop:16424 length:228 start_codon:yes stop_codon:yes gene_type:complete
MKKKISKIGNSHGIIFDSTVMELARLRAGDEVNLEIHSTGAITLTPLDPKRKNAEVSDAIEDVMKRYAQTMQRLA